MQISANNFRIIRNRRAIEVFLAPLTRFCPWRISSQNRDGNGNMHEQDSFTCCTECNQGMCPLIGETFQSRESFLGIKDARSQISCLFSHIGIYINLDGAVYFETGASSPVFDRARYMYALIINFNSYPHDLPSPVASWTFWTIFKTDSTLRLLFSQLDNNFHSFCSCIRQFNKVYARFFRVEIIAMFIQAKREYAALCKFNLRYACVVLAISSIRISYIFLLCNTEIKIAQWYSTARSSIYPRCLFR